MGFFCKAPDTENALAPPGLVVLISGALSWLSVVQDIGKTNFFSSLFPVDKLQFEPPLRKETEAHSEMVIIKSLI